MTTWPATARARASAGTWGRSRRGELTTGAVKLAGIGATGVAAPALIV